MVVAVMVLNTQTGEVFSGPKLLQQGVVENQDPGEVLDEARAYCLDKISGLNAESRRDVSEVSQTLRMALSRFFRRRFARQPVVVPVVTEM